MMKVKGQKVQKNVLQKLKFQHYKSCLKASQVINAVNYLENKGINVDILKEDKKEFIKNKLLSNCNKDLKVRGIIFLLKKLTRLL